MKLNEFFASYPKAAAEGFFVYSWTECFFDATVMGGGKIQVPVKQIENIYE